MNGVRRALTTDQGFTLVELIVTIAIMTIAFAVLLGGMATLLDISASHRKQATVETLVFSYSEDVENWALNNWGSGCQVAASFAAPNVGLSVPAGYTAVPVGVAYWSPSGNSGSFGSSCSGAGLNEVTLQVTSPGGPGGAVNRTVQVLVRKP